MQRANGKPYAWREVAVAEPSLRQDGAGAEFPAEAVPVIDRVEEIPEQYWAAQGARFPRRFAALVADQALLAALLGLFLCGGALALRREGIAVSTLVSGSGLGAARLPLALLGALVSLVYHVVFHAVAGQTPGKWLAGLEVQTREGTRPPWGKAALRWCGAALGLACGGVGIAWALFEPRRRGWADLASGTLIIEHAAEDPAQAGGVDNPRGRGYDAPAVQGRDSSAGRATD